MLNTEEINILGQILNDTFGEYSTKMSPSMSIKTSLAGDVLTCNYISIITLPRGHHDRATLERCADESVQLTDKFMKNLRKNFKEMCTRALKVKQLGTNDSLEMITTSPYSPRKNAYYRRSTSFRVE